MKRQLIIAGVSGNLGREVYEVLAKKDFEKIYLMGRKSGLIINNDKILNIETFDLTVENSVKDAFSQIKVDTGTSYFLFSTIGGYLGGKYVWDTTLEELEKMLKINLYSSFLIAKYFSLLVRESAGGSICFTSAMTSLKGESGKSAYGISKSALNYLVETLALEGKSINLSVNAIAPWVIDTEENRSWVKDSESLIKPEEVGQLVYDLFNNYRFISGSVITLPFRLH